MKIRKVDDKPMVIHTKEKAKIHAHEPKGAKIKGSNIYTVEKGPKTIGAKVSDDKKKSYRKSTIHQSEPKNKGLSRLSQTHIIFLYLYINSHKSYKPLFYAACRTLPCRTALYNIT